MAVSKRRIALYLLDEAGNVLGGTGYQIKVYNGGTRTLATLYLSSSPATSRPNPGSPNSGQQTTLTATGNSADTSLTVASTAGFVVGDVLPLSGGGNRTLVTVKTVTDATHLALENSVNTFLGNGANYATGSTLGGPEQIGHFQCWVDDSKDYDITATNVATLIEGAPQAWPTLQTDNTYFTFQTLTDAATIVNDLGVSPNSKVTLTASGHAMGAPSNIVNGGKYTYRIVQDGTGSRTMTWNAVFKWPGGVAPVLSTAVSAIDAFSFVSPDGTIMENVGQAYDIK